MNLLININFLPDNLPEAENNFLKNSLMHMMAAQPQHHFFIISANKNEPLAAPVNATLVLSKKPASKLARSVWYAVRLPQIIKKTKAGFCINADGNCAQHTAAKQCILLPPILMHDVEHAAKKILLRLNKADLVITASQSFKNTVCKRCKIKEDKIQVVYTAAKKIFLPLSQHDKEICKQKYTEGKEYFFFTGPVTNESNLLTLLKAFSFFKKRQKSNMQLLIAAQGYAPGSLFEKNLQTYKYRTDVQLLTAVGEEELVKLMAAAYVFADASPAPVFYTPVLQAMQSGVPVITGNSLLMHEVCGEAALLTDASVFENIADKMMLLFKDEALRNGLIEKGLGQAAAFGRLEAGDLLWQHIESCLAKNH